SLVRSADGRISDGICSVSSPAGSGADRDPGQQSRASTGASRAFGRFLEDAAAPAGPQAAAHRWRGGPLCPAIPAQRLLRTPLPPWPRVCGRAHAPPFVAYRNPARSGPALRPLHAGPASCLATQATAPRERVLAAGDPARGDLLVRGRADRLGAAPARRSTRSRLG